MIKVVLILIACLLPLASNVFADDVSIDQDGNITTGLSSSGNLEVMGASGEDGIVGSTSGTGASGVIGENTTYGNLGILGGFYNIYDVGVYGYSSSGFAGFFEGDISVTGKLTANGIIETTTGGIKFPDGTVQTSAGTGQGSGGQKISAVHAGFGLLGGGTSGEVSLQVDTSLIQGRVSGACGTGFSIRQINQDGSVVCEQDDGITSESDPTVNSLAKTSLACQAGETVQWNGISWVCNSSPACSSGEDFIYCYTGLAETRDVGSCKSGVRICDQGIFAGVCEGEILPDPEVCDGIDNNCDGQIDESYNDLGDSCTVGTGECKGTGLRVCDENGTGTICNATAGSPVNEVCDGKDNDCNGQVDDGIADVPSTCGEGACGSTGVLQCVNGGLVSTCAPGSPSEEVCDGIDDDCNGQVDDGIADVPTTCGEGASGSTGVLQCVNGEMVDTCVPSDPSENEISTEILTAVPELQAWLIAAKDGRSANVWIDTDNDGAIGPDANSVLAAAYHTANGLCTAYVNAVNNADGDNDPTTGTMSPWNGAIMLWQTAAPGNGFISCQHPANGNITLEGRDNDGNIILTKNVSFSIQANNNISTEILTAVPELQAWITAAIDGNAANIWVDTDGDGSLGPDTNAVLAAAYHTANGLCTAYVNAVNNADGDNDPTTGTMSPWNGAIMLWQTAAPGNGFISCQHLANGTITLEGQDDGGTTILQTYVSTSSQEENEIFTEIFTAAPELQAWIIAVNDGQADNIWIDTNGDGTIGAPDLTNAELATALGSAELCASFIAQPPRNTKMSPWNVAIPLWIAGAPLYGQISCQHTFGGSITLQARDGDGEYILYQILSTSIQADNTIFNEIYNAAPELQAWIRAANDGQAVNIWVDTDNSGIVGDAGDVNNAVLEGWLGTADTLCTNFIDNIKSEQTSPWNPITPLWTTVASATPATDGQISCTHPANGSITLKARDNDGNIILDQFFISE